MSDQAFNPKVVLGVAAHPDDLDFGAAGSMAHWVKRGAKAYYLILTNGNKGTHDRSLSPDGLRDLRREEQREAARILGVSEVFFCDFNDGELVCDLEVKKCISRIIRKTKPDTVVTLDPTMVYSVKRGFINHPDHRAAGQACLDAVYPLARDHLAFPELCNDEGLEPHEVSTMLLVNFDTADFCVDVSDVIDVRLKALAAHKSQIPPGTVDMVKELAAKAGKSAGCDYAEKFVKIDIG